MAYDPVFQDNGIVRALEGHRGGVERTRENSARYAQSFATYTTTGVGEFIQPDAHMFGCTFVSQPVVSYGYSLDGTQLVAGQFPRSFGGIREWVLDEQDFFIGAYPVFVVDTGISEAAPPSYIIDHDFVFTAIALKDLPVHLLGGV